MVIVQLIYVPAFQEYVYVYLQNGWRLDNTTFEGWFYPSEWQNVQAKLELQGVKLTNKWYHRKRVYDQIRKIK